MVQRLWSWWVLAVLVSLRRQHTAVANVDELPGNGPLIPLSKGNVVEDSGPNRTGPWFVIYDFVNAYTVNQVKIINYGDTTHDVKSFKLESSNDYKTWTLVATIDNVKPGTNEPQFFTIYGEGQFWKLTIEEVASDFQPWFTFFSFFGELSLEFGKQFNGPSRLIVGGNNARILEWPWMVALWEKMNTNHRQFFCGGSLITERHVLTAAHCFERNQPVVGKPGYFIKMIRRYQDVVVVLGGYNFKRPSGSEKFFYNTPYRLHEDYYYAYDDTYYRNDLAILKLDKSVKFSAAIRPVRLPAPDDQDFTGMNAGVLGWGDTDGRRHVDKWSHILKEVEVPIVSQANCMHNYSRTPITIKPAKVICAAPSKGGRDSCTGDSGGPLLIQNKSNNRWTVIGIVSFGPKTCGSGLPGVYTRVDGFLKWICDKISDSIYQPRINACK